MMIPGSRERHSEITRAGGAILLAFALSIAGLLAFGDTGAGAVDKLKIKQPKCGKLKKKGKAKKCRNNRMVRKAIGNARFFGTQADGEPIDTMYCENGIHQNDVRLDNYNDQLSTVGWRVESAKVKNDEKFTAILYSKEGIADFVRSISRKGDIWKIGIVKGKKLRALGVAEKQDAREKCSEFGVKRLGLDPIPAPED